MLHVELVWGKRNNKKTSASVKDWCKSPHGITGPPDQSSRNSGNKCQAARPLTPPNFIPLGQSVYEKSVTILTPFTFSASQGTPWVKVRQSGRQGPSINLSNFVNFWQPFLYEISAANVRRFCWRRDPQKHPHITRMWANAQRDGRPAEYRWRPLFNAANLADAHY